MPIYNDVYPVVTAYAGSEILYKQFKNFAFQELQIKETPSQNTTPSVQTSGVFYIYTSSTPNQNTVNYTDYHCKLESEVKKINQDKSYSVGDEFEVFTAIQISSSETVKLTHIYADGIPDEINEYKAIGGSHQYSYMFLRPMYHNDMFMKDFARLGYFIIRYLNKYEMDEHVGGQPHFWCIPNHGDLFDY
jgi:hypothetical protein